MNLKKLSTEYDRLYEKGTKLFEDHNPCRFKAGKCIKNRLDNRRHKRHHNKEGGFKDGCCRLEGRCSRLGPNGCTVKSLGCKLFFCYRPGKEHERFRKHIERLRKEAGDLFTHAVGACPTICYRSKERFFELIRERRK